MIAAPRFLSASGAGDSLARLAMALSAMPLFGPSFAARSNSTVSTPALVRCAAICAPMTPAPSTAALRMRSADEGGDTSVIGFSDGTNTKLVGMGQQVGKVLRAVASRLHEIRDGSGPRRRNVS